jgi:hypothetical protein
VGRLRAPQHRLHPGIELLSGEGFDEVVVRAGVQQPHDLGVVVPGGGDDDRYVLYSAQHPKNLCTVEIG